MEDAGSLLSTAENVSADSNTNKDVEGVVAIDVVMQRDDSNIWYTSIFQTFSRVSI
jgi:hypothetical protein